MSLHRALFLPVKVSRGYSSFGGTYADKVGMPRLDVQVHQIEHDSISKVSKIAVVQLDPLASIDHLSVGQQSSSRPSEKLP